MAPFNAREVQPLKLGAIAQMVPLFAGFAANLLATPYVVTKLGLHDFGIWSIVAAIAQYGALSDLGVSRAANRYTALFHAKGDVKNERAVAGVCAAALAGLICVLYAILPFFAGLMDRILRTGDTGLATSLLFAAVTMVICGLVARTLAATSIGRGRQVPANIGIAVLVVAQVIGGVIALAQSPTLRDFAWGSAAGTGIGLAAVVTIILFDEGRITLGRPSAALAREVLAYGMKGQIQGGAEILWFQAGKVIAGVIVGPAAAGVIELGMRLVKGAQAFGSAASVALTTHLTRTYAAGGMAAILAEYPRLTRRNAAVAIFPPLFLAATALSAVPLWLGERQGAVIFVVMTAAPGIAASVSTGVCAATLLSIGRSGILGVAVLISATISAILSVPLGYAFGLEGIAAAFGAWMIVTNLLLVAFLQSRIKIPMKTFLHAIAGPFAIGLCATAAAMTVGLIANPHDRSSALVPFLLSSLIFTAVYASLGWRLGYLPRLTAAKGEAGTAAGDGKDEKQRRTT